jgi:hypothetical protein
MHHEQDFYKELNAFPAMPDTLYPKVTGKIRRQEIMRRSLWLVAACVVLVVSGFNYHQFSVNRTNQTYMEASEQLQNIGDYFTAQDIKEGYTIISDEAEDTTDNISDITDYFNDPLITEDIEMYAIVSADFL